MSKSVPCDGYFIRLLTSSRLRSCCHWYLSGVCRELLVYTGRSVHWSGESLSFLVCNQEVSANIVSQDFEAIFGLAEAVRQSQAIQDAISSESEAKHERTIQEEAENVG